MKKLIMAVFLILTVFAFRSEAKTPHPGFEFGFFYSSLSPYGTWIEMDYGIVVWRPTIMRRGWAPYRHGSWVWTGGGWYWDSYENFGYITYHYGRWYYDDYYGWIWVPDYEWAPAWVEWRYDDYYIGWAPLPPYAVFSVSVGIHYTHDYYVPYHHWHFVKYNFFCDPYVYKHYVSPQYKYRIHARTKSRTNYDYYDGRIRNRGVDIDYVRKRTGENIRQKDIVRFTDPDEFRKTEQRDNNSVRTLVTSREVINRNDSRNVEIKKSDRRSSLETSRIRRTDSDDVNTRDRITDTNNDKLRKNDGTKDNLKNDNNTRTRKSETEVEKKNPPEIKQRTTENNRDNTRTNTGVKKEVKTGTERNVKKEDPVIKRNEQINKNDIRKNEAPDVKVDTRKRENLKRETTINRDINKRSEVRQQNNVEVKRENRNEVKQQTRTRTENETSTKTNSRENVNRNNSVEKKRR